MSRICRWRADTEFRRENTGYLVSDEDNATIHCEKDVDDGGKWSTFLPRLPSSSKATMFMLMSNKAAGVDDFERVPKRSSITMLFGPEDCPRWQSKCRLSGECIPKHCHQRQSRHLLHRNITSACWIQCFCVLFVSCWYNRVLVLSPINSLHLMQLKTTGNRSHSHSSYKRTINNWTTVVCWLSIAICIVDQC